MSPRKRLNENGGEKLIKNEKKRKILRNEGREGVSKLKWHSKL